MKPNARPMLVIKREKTVQVYADRYDAAPVSTVRISRESRMDMIRYAAAALLTAGICLVASLVDDRRRAARKKR